MDSQPPSAEGPKSILHTDIKDLEFARSLKRLGSIRVTEWEFRDVLPAVNRLAHKEVDVIDLIRRTANYRVTEWDFRDLLSHNLDEESSRSLLSPEEMQALIRRFTRFLSYIANGLIEHPQHAQVKVAEIEPGVLRFKLILTRADAAALIGTGGHTAAAIRRLIQAAGHKHGVHVLLNVLSHEEDAAEAGK